MKKIKITNIKKPSVFFVLSVALILSAFLSYVFKDYLQQLNNPVHITELELNELTPEVRKLVESSNDSFVKIQSILNNKNSSDKLSEREINNMDSLIGNMTTKINKAVELDPDNANLWFYRCNIFLSISSIKGAIDHGIKSCVRSIELNPEKSIVYHSLGNLYVLNNDYDNAIKTFIDLTKIAPNDMSAYYNLGSAYLNKGDKEKARAAFLKALELANNQEDKDKIQKEIIQLGK